MKKVVTFGELMLRITPPGREMILQTPNMVCTFGGAEANVAVAVSQYGDEARYVTALPANDLGRAAVAELRRFGIDTSAIKMTNKRLGLYFTETGSNMRPSKVIYDRDDSAIAAVKPGDFDWDTILADADWFHVTGITPALSESLCDATLEALKKCKEKGITVSCDLNYRKKLWKWGKEPIEVMPEIAKYIDVMIANEEDCQKCLGIELETGVDSGKLDTDMYKELAKIVMDKYPNVKALAVSLRESISADHNNWSGVLAIRDGGFYQSRKYSITNIVDRIGGGDSFGGSLIYGFRNFDNDYQKIIEYAIGGSALKHTTYGDYVRFTKEDVLNLIAGSGNGRIQR
ncbi:MAG: sugar kinase [Clostridia bacterium]|nr:sugar kinase [Clostridia bacterium]MBQ5648689.1 sugar kinase [Clostridia bacterium]MBQ5808439.1 sugar kinase [Clostridia bacterium]MBR0326184.1 sugar kinase [Clostridia bacterium]